MPLQPRLLLELTCSSPEGHRRSHRLSLQPGYKMTNYLKFLQELAIRQVLIYVLSYSCLSLPHPGRGGLYGLPALLHRGHFRLLFCPQHPQWRRRRP